MQVIKSLTARSPAKLILSGEHAVVYGRPALAIAVNRYAHSTVSRLNVPSIFFNLKNLKYAKLITLETLTELKTRLLKDYRFFLEGQCNIRTVLQKPFELLQFTVFNLLEKLAVKLPHGVHLQTASTIPIGCGMGSSAASVISTLKVLTSFFKIELDPKKYLSLGRDSENLQHGYSSGLDLHLALHGGSIYFQNGIAQSRSISTIPMSLVYTGKPLSTTGECVEFVRQHFQDPMLGEAFEDVTIALDRAFQANALDQVGISIQENHKLLTRIGVVPPRVQTFIQALEQRGLSAKICGAGSVQGEYGGVVLVVGDQDYTDLIEQFNFTRTPVCPDLYGTQIV